MKKRDKNIEAFFALLRAGLWEKEDRLASLGVVDYEALYKLAEEQSVTGLLAAGLEQVKDVKVPQAVALKFAGSALQLEQRNRQMNSFVSETVLDMRKQGVYMLLVKGQAIARRYERPLWRASGDVDFFLSEENYDKAKNYLVPKASAVEPEGKYGQHLGMSIDGYAVELHGNLRGGFSSRADKVLDKIRYDSFNNGNVNSWTNERVQIFVLSKENEVFYVFTHFLGHFYKGGIGLRQICDWCRLLWTYRESLDLKALGLLLKEAGLMSEWKAFGAFANEYLGLEEETIPFYSDGAQWRRKAARIMKFIMKVGNFGHNRDMSYFSTKPYLVRKAMSLGRRTSDLMNHLLIFPLDTLRFTPRILINGLRSAANGE